MEVAENNASFCEKIKCFELLIKAGADVNMTTSEGPVPLVQAAIIGLRNGVELLMQAGADVNILCDYLGATPLMAATSGGFFIITKLLLQAGADVNSSDSDGHTALMSVSMGTPPLWEDELYEDEVDCLGCARILLQSGAKINIKTSISRNGLHFLLVVFPRGVDNYRFDVCRILFAAGETLDGIADEKFPDCLKFDDVQLDLKHICREAIRKHLLELDPHTYLFGRVSQLGLPSLLIDYLLYDMSLDEDIDNNINEDKD